MFWKGSLGVQSTTSTTLLYASSSKKNDRLVKIYFNYVHKIVLALKTYLNIDINTVVVQ